MTVAQDNLDIPAADDSDDRGKFEGVQTPFRRFLSDFCESKLAVLGFFVIVAIISSASGKTYSYPFSMELVREPRPAL